MEIFRFIRIQAKFEIPKKLGILESLVNFISQGNHANYSSFISLLENEGVDNNLIRLWRTVIRLEEDKKYSR